MFIDWDNFAIGLREEMPTRPPDLRPVLRWAQQLGPVAVCRAYGEWRDASERLAVYSTGVEVVYAPVLPLASPGTRTNGGKSLADTAMAVDCVDLLHLMPDIATLIIASSDKDLIPILRFGQRRGLRVVVVGSDRTAAALRDQADECITYRMLLEREGDLAHTPPVRPSEVPPGRFVPAPRLVPAPSLVAPPPVPSGMSAATSGPDEAERPSALTLRRRRRRGRRRRGGGAVPAVATDGAAPAAAPTDQSAALSAQSAGADELPPPAAAMDDGAASAASIEAPPATDGTVAAAEGASQVAASEPDTPGAPAAPKADSGSVGRRRVSRRRAEDESPTASSDVEEAADTAASLEVEAEEMPELVVLPGESLSRLKQRTNAVKASPASTEAEPLEAAPAATDGPSPAEPAAAAAAPAEAATSATNGPAEGVKAEGEQAAAEDVAPETAQPSVAVPAADGDPSADSDNAAATPPRRSTRRRASSRAKGAKSKATTRKEAAKKSVKV